MASSPGQEAGPWAVRPQGLASRTADGPLRLTHEMLAGVVAAAPVGIAVFEDGCGCVYVNSCGRRLIGARSRQEAARAIDDVGRSPGLLGERWPGLEFREISSVSAGLAGPLGGPLAGPLGGPGSQHIITFSRAAPQLRPEHRLQGLSRAVADMAESG